MQPDLGSLGLLAALSLQLLLELSGLGALAVAFLAEGLAEARKQVFLRKLAQQLSAMSLWLLGYTVVTGGAMLWIIHRSQPDYLALWVNNPILALPLAAGLGLTVLLALLYRATWKPLKERKTLHRTIGLLAALCGFTLLAAALSAKLTLTRPYLNEWFFLPATLEGMYFYPPLDKFWPMLAHVLLWAMAGGAGLGLVYLLMRRNRDDFGRDYYAYAVRHCARWAAVPALLQLGAAAALLLPAWEKITPEMKSTATGLAAGGALAAVLAAILLFNVSRAEAPLRHKPALLGAVALLAAALAGPTGLIMLAVQG
ncbi:MAG: hypothetical protein AB1916_10030 [Thermodesulfobacteriota bacterium]